MRSAVLRAPALLVALCVSLAQAAPARASVQPTAGEDPTTPSEPTDELEPDAPAQWPDEPPVAEPVEPVAEPPVEPAPPVEPPSPRDDYDALLEELPADFDLGYTFDATPQVDVTVSPAQARRDARKAKRDERKASKPTKSESSDDWYDEPEKKKRDRTAKGDPDKMRKAGGALLGIGLIGGTVLTGVGYGLAAKSNDALEDTSEANLYDFSARDKALRQGEIGNTLSVVGLSLMGFGMVTGIPLLSTAKRRRAPTEPAPSSDYGSARSGMSYQGKQTLTQVGAVTLGMGGLLMLGGIVMLAGDNTETRNKLLIAGSVGVGVGLLLFTVGKSAKTAAVSTGGRWVSRPGPGASLSLLPQIGRHHAGAGLRVSF